MQAFDTSVDVISGLYEVRSVSPIDELMLLVILGR